MGATEGRHMTVTAVFNVPAIAYPLKGRFLHLQDVPKLRDS
jgi:hypothetical protein